MLKGYIKQDRSKSREVLMGGYCFTVEKSIKVTVIGVICRRSSSPFIFSLLVILLILLTCKDIKVSSAGVPVGSAEELRRQFME